MPQFKAFTLVELLVVITIITILLALLTPGLDKAVELAERARCASNLHVLHQGVVQYAYANRRVITPIHDTSAALKQDVNNWPRWFFLMDTGSTTVGHYWN